MVKVLDYEKPSGAPQLKKGPWTLEEDKRLKDYVEAKMASQLPGRTDNEIKNFWNTRINKTKKQGLPVYLEHVLSQVKQPQQDMNYETPGESHGKKRLREYSKEMVIGMHDLIDDKISFQHLDYDKDPVVPTKPLKRRASTGSLQISGETKETFCSTDLNYVLSKSQLVPPSSAIASGYPVELHSIQSSSYTPSNDWLLQCVSASVEQKIHNFIQSPEPISSQTTGLLGASIHNIDILDDPTKSGRSFEIPIPMLYPMIHSFGDFEHESSPNTDIQASNLSLGSGDVFYLSQYYQVASFSDPGVPDTQLGASFFNDTPPEASFLNGTPPEASILNGTPPETSFLNDTALEASFLNGTPPEASSLNGTQLEASFMNGNSKDQSHLYCQEPKPLTDGGQWFDPCRKPRSVSSSTPLHNQGQCNNHD